MRKYIYENYGLNVSESKNYLRIESNEDDVLISALITASAEQVFAECNQIFVPTTCSMNVWSSSGDIFLSTQTVSSVSTGSLKEVNGSWYSYVNDVYSGQMVFTVGESGSMPSNAKVAQLMLVANWYENRLPQIIGVSATPLDFSVKALLSPYTLVKPQ